jgi:MFS family permease
VPLVVFQLFGGVLADRLNRLRLLIATQVGLSLTLAVTLALAVSGRMRLGHLLVLAVLTNTFRAFDEPSRMSLVPQLVGRERLPNAIALGSIPWQAGRMVGPSLAGLLIAAFGGSVGFAMALAGSGAALALYAQMRVTLTRPRSDGQRVLRQFTDGLRFVAGNAVFTSLIALALFNSLFAMSYLTLLLMAFAYAPVIGLAVALLIGVGFCNTFYLTQVSTYLQQQVPDQLRGRVMSLYSLCWNLMPLGGLLAGVLAAAVDARFAVLAGGAVVAANALLLLGSARLRAIR